MKQILTLTALMASLATTATAEPVGFRDYKIKADHHTWKLKGAVFYPAENVGRTKTYAENGVFQGIEIAKKADMADGKYPIIMLSHGMGGDMRTLAWLASDLANRGAIVVAVNHKHGTWRDFDLAKAMQHWTRAQDISAALDQVTADPRFEGKLDTSRIAIVGFSFGGWTALSLAGATSNKAGFLSACETHRATMNHCDEVLSDASGIARIDEAVWNKSYADARITTAIAIDPGLIWGTKPDNLTDLSADITMIGLGDGTDRMIGTDFDRSGLTDLTPDADHIRIAPGVHFSAMPLCKPEGPAILEAENDDPVCTDPEGSDRAKIHDQIADIVASKLGLAP